MRQYIKKRAWQNFFTGTVLALGPGTYVAITLLGAGGGQTSSVRMANIANSTLYGTFICICLVCGAITNMFGPRVALSLASMGYPAYIATLWVYQIYGHIAIPVVGAAILGCCAALLWTSSTFVSYAYPDSRHKGRYIAMQWGMVNLASTIANLVVLGLTFDTGPWRATNSVYIAFICVTSAAVVIAVFSLVPLDEVEPPLVSSGASQRKLTLLGELKLTVSCLKDTRLLTLLLPSFASEISTVAVSTTNGIYFDIRTRALNSFLYTVAQLLGCLLLSVSLDYRGGGDPRRHQLVAVAGVALCTVTCWATLLAWHMKYGGMTGLQGWESHGYGLACVAMMFHGLNLSIYQIVTQYLVSKSCRQHDLTASFSALTRAAIAAGLLFAFGTAISGMRQTTLSAIYFAVQGAGLSTLAFNAAV